MGLLFRAAEESMVPSTLGNVMMGNWGIAEPAAAMTWPGWKAEASG